VEHDFAPAIEDALKTYEVQFGTHLCAIYLSGSLAYGEGLPGISDMDMFGFIDYEPESCDLQWRPQTEEMLGRRYPQVEHFCLNINSLDFVAKQDVWRFILRYNSVRLRGEDIVAVLEQRGVQTLAPTKELAKSRLGWTRRCFQGYVEGQVPTELFTLPENPYLATRKLAKYFVILEGTYLLMADGEFSSFQTQDVLRQLRCCYPQWEELYAIVEAAQYDPIAVAVDPKEFLVHLTPFMHWAIARVEAA
jgi:hypothetical protein